MVLIAVDLRFYGQSLKTETDLYGHATTLVWIEKASDIPKMFHFFLLPKRMLQRLELCSSSLTF